MITLKFTSLITATLILLACSSKKSTSSTVAPLPVVATSIIPGEAELLAIKTKYPDATAAQLSEGHSIFTGACTNCHKAYNIFKRSEASWLHEIEDMSPKANLTDTQKEALTKYILSMKATQPASTK